ncbi:LOW QUALITY PROTEIN: hypothetical protein CH63R_00323 [Colletotrichum higginsianum IMI 349063]|uniref:Uncharacterized protein n=1 Tax=Colletotrichum higginsianum (strain IMI 349063) TaxID=759273 RepID=A0A1B7YSZ5_COLHI|nr:LOW QUALITY PROTEIN: hypothetical protein CH63R_00323 [Colletotrichum higginsianum IMI 349063]OBR15143.1 LOW QUALITY PROTEIN: hypothetical protein CH63R_00323 [Colletotrichum higginsianum IMI 349063]
MDHLSKVSPAISRRQRMRTILLALTYACATFGVIVQILTLIAGRWVIRSGSGSESLALSSLSVVRNKPTRAALQSSNPAVTYLQSCLVQFDGIIPSPGSDSYLVTMHHFAASFGYEYPDASKAGILGHSPRFPRDLVAVARALELPPADWACLRGPETCAAPFFQSFSGRGGGGGFGMPATIRHLSLAYALVLVLYIATIEVLIAARPSWLRCRCYFSCFTRVCPCPRGARAEIEALPGVFWDRYRLWTWGLLPCAAFLPTFVTTLHGLPLVRFMERREVGDMNVRFGTGFVVVQAACFGASLAAVVCVYLRRRLGRGMVWMEEGQGMATKE